MADHLAYIRIKGLELDPEECFQGMSTDSTDNVSGGDNGNSKPTDWGTIPEEALTMINQYITDVNAWIEKAVAYDPSGADRGISRERGLPAIVGAAPMIPAIIGTVATGGAALPAIASVMLSQTIMGLIGASIQNYAATLDPNSPQSLLRQALMYKDGATWKSILKQALLFDLDDNHKNTSVLNQRLKDLLFQDQEIDWGAFREYLRGKIIEY